MKDIESKQELALYIHVPFCKAKCNYCDFNSYSGKDAQIPLYFDALKKEIEIYADKIKNYTFKTVFIGGGTPSLVETKYIYEMFNMCCQKFNIPDNAEVTIETNPGTLSYNKLLGYKAIGINRISIGLQAWQEDILKTLGRIHSAEQFVENFNLAEKVGFKNINVDLIFGLPDQTLNDWTQTLKNVISLGPTHISCYSLKIEEGTVFGSQLDSGKLLAPDDELDRKMYYAAINELGRNGYKHYEISNFAREGFECRHNIVYWKGENYLGLGAGSHSFLDGKRFNNISSIEGYIRAIENKENIIENVDDIDINEQMLEFIILGLRLIEGISPIQFKKRYQKDIFDVYGVQIKKLVKKEMLNIIGDKLFLTPIGLDYANQVFVEFI